MIRGVEMCVNGIALQHLMIRYLHYIHMLPFVAA